MPPSQPILTIGIPTYNSAHFLGDSLGSVLRQRLDDYEIVIVDNASTDNTQEIIRSFGNKHIRYFRNETNLGSRVNHNRCLEEARGTYFKFLGADDVLLDGVLSKQLSVLQLRPDVSLVSCNMSVTDAGLAAGKVKLFYPGTCAGSRVVNACLSMMNNDIGGPSNFMFRLRDVENIRMDPDYRYVSDLKLGLKLLQQGDYANIDEVGYLYRRHTASDTHLNCPEDIMVSEYISLVQEFGWWNILSCVQAIRRGRSEGRKAVFRNWSIACMPHNLIRAITVVPDVFRIWRTNSSG